MKKLITLMCLVMFSLGVAAVAQTSPESSPPVTGSPAAQKYTCPMHPEVEQDKPGKCPKCGMKLESKKEDDKKK